MRPTLANVLTNTTLTYILLVCCQSLALGQRLNTITTSHPHLAISSQAVVSALADITVVGDEYHPEVGFNGNPALLHSDKIAFTASAHHSPWLRTLVPNIWHNEACMVIRPFRRYAIGAQARYFHLGTVSFIDGTQRRSFEGSVQLNQAFQLTPHMSIGVAFKYSTWEIINPIPDFTARAFSADIGYNYDKNLIEVADYSLNISPGIALNNIGNALRGASGGRSYLPMRILLGCVVLNSYERGNVTLEAGWSYQMQKLLVPTFPIYAIDSNGQVILDGNDPVIFSGYDNNVPVAQAIFQSFVDAPGYPITDDNGVMTIQRGSRVREEFAEIIHQFGGRYSISTKDVRVTYRNGLFFEHWTKGNRKYLSNGLSLEVKGVELGIAHYLVFTLRNTSFTSSPLANTLAFSMSYRLKDKSSTKSQE